MTRKRIRIASFFAALLVILCGMVFVQTSRARTAERMLEATYQRAIGNLHSAMTQIAAALNKGQYVTSPELLSVLAGEISAKSSQIMSALGELPYRDGNVLSTAKFIAQVGDYAYVLSENADVQKTSETFAALSKTAEELLPYIHLRDEKLPADEHFSQTMERINEEFPEYPTLVYDGPFSEHLKDKESAMLFGKRKITQYEARKIASEFLNVDIEQTLCGSLTGGVMPTYTVYAANSSVDVTQVGGFVRLMLSGRAIGNAKITHDEAREIARKFLAEHGYTNMRESYHTAYANTIMIDFNATQDGVRLYPDLVKITVALDDGSIVGFETDGYLSNHKKRDLPEIKISEREILKQIPQALRVKEISLALIPTGGENELLTYEVVCENKEGEHVLLYYDVRDGEQKKILILIEDANGALVM